MAESRTTFLCLTRVQWQYRRLQERAISVLVTTLASRTTSTSPTPASNSPSITSQGSFHQLTENLRKTPCTEEAGATINCLIFIVWRLKSAVTQVALSISHCNLEAEGDTKCRVARLRLSQVLVHFSLVSASWSARASLSIHSSHKPQNLISDFSWNWNVLEPSFHPSVCFDVTTFVFCRPLKDHLYCRPQQNLRVAGTTLVSASSCQF